MATGDRQDLLHVVVGHLLAEISDSALSMRVATDEGAWPATPFYVTIGEAQVSTPPAGPPPAGWEIVKVDAIAGDVFTILRGQRGTTARAHTFNDPVVLGLNADDVARLLAHLEAPGGGGGGVTDHGLLTGLADDDHPQYETSAEAAAKVTAHEAAADPHTGYVQESAHTLAAHDSLGLATDTELSTHSGNVDGHHARSHAHNGADGSGTVAHSATTGQTVDDHHARDHAIGGSTHTGQLGHSALSGVTADQHHAQAHSDADHTSASRVTVRKNSGADVGTRPRLNLIEGSNITLTVADDAAGGEVDVTIASTGGGGGGLTVREDGVLVGTRAAVNLLTKANDTFWDTADDAGNGEVEMAVGTILGTFWRVAPAPSGGDDLANLQAWINASNPGDTLLFRLGVYSLSAPLVYKPGRRYVGAMIARGVGGTVLRLANGANPTAAGGVTGVFVPEGWDSNTTAAADPVEIAHLAIDGNKANNATGQHVGLIVYDSFWSRFHDLRLFNNKSDGLRITSRAKNGTSDLAASAADNHYRDIQSASNDCCGIRQLDPGGTGAHQDVVIDGQNLLHDNGESALNIRNGGGWRVEGVHSWNCGEHGIYFDNNGFSVQIRKCYIENFGTDNAAAAVYYGIRIRIFGGRGATIAECDVATDDPAGTATFQCYRIEGQDPATHVVLADNRAYGANTSRGWGFAIHSLSGTFSVEQQGNLARNFVANQDFEWGGTIAEPHFTTPAASAPGDTQAEGTSYLFARADHRHAREGFGAVTAQTSYGASSGNGAAATLARSDHTHGTVARQQQTTTFSLKGTLTSPQTGKGRWYANRALTIVSVRASWSENVTGTDAIVDVNKNGTTIFTTQANRPQIAVGTATDLSGTPDVTALAQGDYLTVDLDQAPTNATECVLTVEVEYTVD